MSIINVRLILRILAVTIVIALLAGLFLELTHRNTSTISIASPPPSRSVAEVTLPLHEKWRVSNVFLPYHTVLPSGIYADESYVFL
jgi:hypothetical protein